MNSRILLTGRCKLVPASRGGAQKSRRPNRARFERFGRTSRLLAVGQSMKTICTWLAEEAGITLGVTSLTSYLSRIRRRESQRRRSIPTPAVASSTSTVARPERVSAGTSVLQGSIGPERGATGFDPLANFRASQAKNLGFHYRPATAQDEKDLV